MRKLQYKGTQEKNEVLVDIMNTQQMYLESLGRLVGMFNTKHLPDNERVLKVTFFIKKGKPSWFMANGKRYDFVYDITKSEKIDTFKLSFKILTVSRYTGAMIEVPQQYYFSKQIIKFILDALI